MASGARILARGSTPATMTCADADSFPPAALSRRAAARRLLDARLLRAPGRRRDRAARRAPADRARGRRSGHAAVAENAPGTRRASARVRVRYAAPAAQPQLHELRRPAPRLRRVERVRRAGILARSVSPLFPDRRLRRLPRLLRQA